LSKKKAIIITVVAVLITNIFTFAFSGFALYLFENIISGTVLNLHGASFNNIYKYNKVKNLLKTVYIDKVDDPNSVIQYSQVGKRAPIYCTGVGKAILAYLPESFMESNVFNRQLVKYTPNTITARDSLLKELETIRLNGYSQDNEEIEFGLRCVAAPIFNHRSVPIGAISVSAPAGRFSENMVGDVAKEVKLNALKISKAMGFGI
jgi:DNA-binding IclR family transcriptional regulator